jgi:hypothetical protein
VQLDDTAALPGGGARRGLEPTDADDDEDDEGDWKAGASVVVMNDVDDDESPAADADADAVAADGLHRRRRSADDALASARHVNEVYHEVRPGLEQAEELLLSV